LFSFEGESLFSALRLTKKSHFWDLNLREVQAIDVSLLERIVSSPGLRLETEDSFLDFICSLGCAEEIILLRQLRSQCFSFKGISAVLNRLSDSHLDESAASFRILSVAASVSQIRQKSESAGIPCLNHGSWESSE
jgi:hypothetical protein